MNSAMKAGDRDRAAALRLVLSELQKDAKEGAGDELAVLRRERKRRRESEAAYRELCIHAHAHARRAGMAMRDRLGEERGQTAAEYMGILFIVAAIIVAIVGAHLEKTIADRLGKIVTAIGNGVTP